MFSHSAFRLLEGNKLEPRDVRMRITSRDRESVSERRGAMHTFASPGPAGRWALSTSLRQGGSSTNFLVSCPGAGGDAEVCVRVPQALLRHDDGPGALPPEAGTVRHVL